MTEEKLNFILSKQLPDAEKRARADYVIDTSLDLETTARQVERIIAELKNIGQAEWSGKSYSTPKRRAWIRRRATVSSRSARWNC
jgi:hypothetical protein